MPLSVINITLQGITLKSTDIISDPVIEEKLGRI
jgi:hypothetical protein